MSSTILSGDFTVYYTTDSARKQLRWTGTTGTYSINQLYSALQDLFDEEPQLNDGASMSAQTPTEYTIGAIDPSDVTAWFIDDESTKHLTGGAIETKGWTRVVGTNAGIVRVECQSNASIVIGDIGLAIDNGGPGSTGVLLDVVGSGADTVLWIRPTDETSTHNWTATGATITVNGHTAVSEASSPTSSGENLWSNIFSVGTIAPNSRLYVTREDIPLTNWWPEGHFDILVLVQEADVVKDSGDLSVFIRQFTKLFDQFFTNVADGGRTVIPLATSTDINNTSGYRNFVGSSGNGTFDAKNAIYTGTSWATATAKGLLTLVGGNVSAPNLTYYLIGDTVTDVSGTVYEYDFITDPRTTNCVVGSQSTVGPGLSSNISISFAGPYYDDVDDEGNNESYSILINVDLNPLTTLFERLKYVTRGGETTITFLGIQGEEYIGIDTRVDFTTESVGGITNGNLVTQANSGATGTVVNYNVANLYMTLTDTSGTFDTSNSISDVTGTVTGPMTIESVTPVKTTPFGTLAGGTFFGARGVLLANVAGSDTNKYEVIADDGVTYKKPISVSYELTNLIAGTEVRLFRQSDNAELAGTDNSGTSFSYNYTYAGDVPIYVVILHISYIYQRFATTLTDTSTSVPIQYGTDRVYNNP